MNRAFFILVAVCAFAAAMVPRDRRAVNTDDKEPMRAPVTTGNTSDHNKPIICTESIPCAWTIYHPITRIEEMNIKNSYCSCDEGLECQMNEDDSTNNSYVYRCRVPSSTQESVSDS